MVKPARHPSTACPESVREIHEAFAAQLIADLKAAPDPVYRHAKAGVDFDMGRFTVDRINPNGGSIALGQPFGAKGQGTVALLQRI